MIFQVCKKTFKLISFYVFTLLKESKILKIVKFKGFSK